MPLWVSSIVGGFIEVAGTLVGKVLLSLGIGYVAYSGIDTALTVAKDAFLDGMAGLPADAIAIAALLKIGTCVSMLLSAVATKFLIAGATSGALKKMVIK